MKIRSIHLREVGPITERVVSFGDEWQGGIEDQILLSGPNGCGKSTVLRAVAILWSLAGSWLFQPAGRPERLSPFRKRLEQWRSSAVIIDDFPVVGTLGLFFGEAADFDELKQEQSGVHWLGELGGETPGGNRVFREMIHRADEQTNKLSENYKLGMLSGRSKLPNFIYLDGEDRRWVKSNKGKIDEVLPDDAHLRWLTVYAPSTGWKGQLETSLINLKTIKPERYYKTIEDLNRFLKPKRINPEPHPVSLRLKIEIPPFDHRNDHTLDELSSGEKQVMTQIYLVSRWLEPGGVVMIDEPDLHLHPSLLSVFLSTLERLVKEREGQLILTSHNPELWRRYENKGVRIKLGEEEEA